MQAHLLLQHPFLLLNLSESLEQFSDLVVRQFSWALRLRTAPYRLTDAQRRVPALNSRSE